MKTCTKCGETKDLTAFYFRKDHQTYRNDCIACNNAAARKWAAANRDRVLKRVRAWQKANPERTKKNALATQKRQRERNPEKFKARFRQWYKANKDKSKHFTEVWKARNPGWYETYKERNKDLLREKRRERRLANPSEGRARWQKYMSQKRRSMPSWLNAIQLSQIQEFYDVATALETQTGIKHHVDHIHPLRGKTFRGLHVPWNLQVLIAEENLRKAFRAPPEALHLAHIDA